MAESMVIELLKPIAEKLGSHVWKRIVDAANIESQIKGLGDIKNTIEATLLDADSTPVCSHSQGQRLVLEKLECALAKLIDFQDAKVAKAKQKQLMGGSKFTKEARLFFSNSNQLVSPFKDARKIRGITGELSCIARNHAQFGSIVSSSSYNQTQTLSNVSRSYMSTDMVVGRNGDRDKMVSLLLDSSAAAGILPVASFVGMGGIGKTTLAQYVYKDERIRSYFELQLWVYVTQYFSVKDVLRHMVTCATGEKIPDYEIDQLQRRLISTIGGKRFLLVLDGVWDDDSLRAKWLQLRPLLMVGAQGSQVLITTRSDTVARIIGTQEPHMVGDLGDDDCLFLFQYVAATGWHEPGVKAIAKDIAKMCPKVPLVIRAIGSLLAGKRTVQEWRAFRKDQLSNFAFYSRDIIGTLRLSYDQLDRRLQLCASYCSLFPKGFWFNKSTLTRLWIALGYAEIQSTNQSLEEVAERYVLCLLNQGFFYCNDRDGPKCPDSFQMHNLMHDLVLSIGGFRYKMADSETNEFDERVRHVSYHLSKDSSLEVPSSIFKIKQLESFLLPLLSYVEYSAEQVRLPPLNHTFISRIQSMRVLRISGVGINKLPRSIGQLIHLRYLDFSCNLIRKLPESITQLVNLYLLDLSWCKSLEELPEEISKLVALRHLHLQGCDNLSHMPKGLLRLTHLETLDHFVVGKPKHSLFLYGSKAKLACDLSDLSSFNNLKGRLIIDLADRSKDMVSQAKAANLERKEITDFIMNFRESRLEDEMVLENLKPNAGLNCLVIEKYGGKRLPSWMREGIHCSLPNLVEVRIIECKECINLCFFGRLPHLKYMCLQRLHKVEYIENSNSNNNDNMVVLADGQPLTPLFPSLIQLTLRDIPELKGWCGGADIAKDQFQIQLPQRMPPFPKLKFVHMDMELVILLAQGFLQGISSLHSLYVYGKTKERKSVILLQSYLPMLRSLWFFWYQMDHLAEEFSGMSSLESLGIYECKALESIPEWIDSLTSLQNLTIQKCPGLKSLPDEMSNLSNLKSLALLECSREIAERCQEPSGEDWPKIQHIPHITIKPA